VDALVKQSKLSKEVKNAQVQLKTATDKIQELKEKYGRIIHFYIIIVTLIQSCEERRGEAWGDRRFEKFVCW